MAFDDTLFQLGMDLTRSSTAQKEDPNALARELRAKVREDQIGLRDRADGVSSHLIADLFGAKRLEDLKHVERTLRRCLEVAGAEPLHVHLLPAGPKGTVSGVAVADGGHISFHGRPDTGFAAFDIFIAHAPVPERAIDVLRVAFDAERITATPLERGGSAGEQTARPVAAPQRATAKAAGKPARVRRAA